MPGELPFLLIAALTLVSAVAAMCLRNLVHCALCIAGAFAGVAAIYLQLDAEFVGFAQILVYVGAVAILILFAVLLTRSTEIKTNASANPMWRISGICIAMLVLVSIAIPILQSPSLQRLAPPTASAPVKKIGEELMTRYVLPLETIGLLLTAALLGAVVIALRDKKSPAPQPTFEMPKRGNIEPSHPTPRFDFPAEKT